MKKKLVTILLVVVLVFNFICANYVYADLDDAPQSFSELNGKGELKGEQVEKIVNDGTTSDGSSPELTGSVLGTIFQTIALVFNSFPITISSFMTLLAKNPTGDTDPLTAVFEFVVDLTDVSNYFTIQRTVFNEVAFFNIDVFNIDGSYEVGIGSNAKTINQIDSIKKLKESTAKWFYVCRLLAIMINLCVLIYIGIRMAISTVASDQARYKKMLMAWVESIVILFLLQYIMSFIIQVGNVILNVIYDLREGMNIAVQQGTGEKGFEATIMANMFRLISASSGLQTFMYSVFFWFLVLIQAKFFLTYLKRVLSIMFLTIISPFITVTYSIDKIGDNKAQAFHAWLSEYIINVVIQPIHAAIYLVFVFSAGEIAAKAPFVAMVFLLSLGRIEDIVRNILGISGSVSMKNFNDELKKFGGGKRRRG